MKKWKWILLPIAVFAMVFSLFRFVFFIGFVPSASMEPTLKENSFILGTRIYDDLKVGDIIIFEHDGTMMVKRIAATEGETIEVEGKVYTVPENSYFVLGDNSENSYDSRYWKNPFVCRKEIVAKVVHS